MHALYDGRTTEQLRDELAVPAVHVFDSIGSTNDAARQLADDGAESLTIVLTDQQTHGRGRSGKSWLSAPGASLICSIIFHGSSDRRTTPGAAPLRVGLAVARAVETVSGIPAKIKWPNDIVIGGHGKIAGILCESSIRHEDQMHVIAGIGINVGYVSADYVALQDVAQKRVARTDLLRAIIEELRAFAGRITQPLTPAELSEFHARDILLDQEVETDDGGVAVARGILPDGSLRLQAGNEMRAVHNASIRLAHSKKYPGATT